MKTELLALIDDLVKSELYVTEGKFSAAKDAKRIRADIVFLLDKAEQEEAAIGAGGVERLRSDAPAAVKPPASQRDELLQVALDFIGTLTGMSPPPIEVAPPEVFAPFYDFVDRVQAITSAAPAAPADALDAEIALRKVLSAVQLYLPPDGISIDVAMNEVIAAVDPWPIGRVKDES